MIQIAMEINSNRMEGSSEFFCKRYCVKGNAVKRMGQVKFQAFYFPSAFGFGFIYENVFQSLDILNIWYIQQIRPEFNGYFEFQLITLVFYDKS